MDILTSKQKTLHLYHFVALWDDFYGKRHKRLDISFQKDFCFCEIVYRTKPMEAVMLKIWIEAVKDDPLAIKPDFRWLLWLENIYINEFIMEKPEDRKHFRELLSKLACTPAQYHFDFWVFSMNDRKLLTRLQERNMASDRHNTQWFEDRNSRNRYWYNEAVQNLPFLVQLDGWLTDKLHPEQ